MNAVAEKPGKKVEPPQMTGPKKGERYRCEKCGMEIQVTEDCKCGAGHHARFECCGQPLARV